METEDIFVWMGVHAVCREWPRVEALPHAVHLIQAYRGNISLVALPNVLEEGNTHLFYRVLHAVEQSSSLVHHEKLRQYRLAMRLIPAKTTMEEGALKAMRDLYTWYPGCVDSETISAVCEMADLSVLKWLYAREKCMLFKKYDWSEETLFYYASVKGRANVVRWLVELFPDHVRTIAYAVQGGHLNLIKWLMKQAQWDKLVDGAFIIAVAGGHLETAQFLQEKRTSNYMTISQRAASEEDLAMMRWLDKCTSFRFEYTSVDAASSNGHLEMVRWLHVKYSKHFSSQTMNCAAANGHLEVVEFLHTNRQEGCTTAAMDQAAANGHLEILQWLHENRSEGCTVDAMDSAASACHLAILKWLHENCNEGCTLPSYVMGNAVRGKHFGIAKWLYEHLKQDYTKDFAENLAEVGNLEMLMWLHSNGKGKWTKNVMNEAASNGHLNMCMKIVEKAAPSKP